MKHLTKLFLVLTVAILALVSTSCDKESDRTTSLVIKLKYETSTSLSVADIPVVLSNNSNTFSETKNTNTSGEVEFTNIPEDVYVVKIDHITEGVRLSSTATDISTNVAEQTIKTISLSITTEKDMSPLVIKELYYNGSSNFEVMFKEQFVEIYNNSNEVQYADGLCIADLYGDTSYPSNNIASTQFNIEENVYANWISMVPGSGKDYPIEPGKTLLISFNAVNFKAEVSENPELVLDLTISDFEQYGFPWLVKHRDETDPYYFDMDNPDVEDMVTIYITEGLDACQMDMTGSSVVLFRKDKVDLKTVTFHAVIEGDKYETQLIEIPVSLIIDGADMLGSNSPDVIKAKRIPSKVDSGFHYLQAEGDESMTGKSVRRKVDENLSEKLGRIVLQDTNNSTNDFEVMNTPTPKVLK